MIFVVIPDVGCGFADNLADENAFDLPTFLFLKLGDEVDAMNDEISGVFFDSFLLVVKTDFGFLTNLFVDFETLLVDLNFVENSETDDFFGIVAFFSENFFDDFFDENADALLALFFVVGLNLVRNFETCGFGVLGFLDVNLVALPLLLEE